MDGGAWWGTDHGVAKSRIHLSDVTFTLRPLWLVRSDATSKVLVELLGSYMEDNASQARADAHRCIMQSLKDPYAFLSDHLLTLKPVKFLEGKLMHDLLTIFVSAKLASYVISSE